MSVPVLRGSSRQVLPYALLAVVVAAHVALIVPSIFTQRLWEDEAFNLTVPLNLLSGLGYTSDGTLSGSSLTPFDVRISTGPVVLLPIALFVGLGFDPVIGGRLVAAGFWLLLVAGLAVLGHRVSGAWGAVVAAALPLTLQTFQGYSPIQGPADILGEPAAAALIVWAVVLMRSRPVLAGLVAGLAIQAKFIALLALPALTLGLLVLVGAGPRRWVPVLWKPAVMALVPTVLYELIALLNLGVSGFIVHAKQFLYFLLSSGQTVEPTTLGERLQYLMSSWFVPGVVMWVAAILGAVLVVIALTRLAPGPGVAGAEVARDRLSIAVVALAGLAVYLLWWGTASHTPLWIRHPAPALLSFVPMLGAFVALGIRALGVRAAEGRARGLLARGTGVVLALAFGVLLVTQVAANLNAAHAPRAETLSDQREVASALAPVAAQYQGTEFDLEARNDSAWIAADPWGAAVNIVLLTGAHMGLSDAPPMDEALRIAVGECASGEALATSSGYSLCSAR